MHMKKHLLPILILFFLWLVIVYTNHIPGTWLTGWDTIHAEFNFGLNVHRSLTAVWQEYQGTGLMGGMGHAADLPRQLILWTLSPIIPAYLMRYLWTMVMLLLGILGTYTLIYDIIQKARTQGSQKIATAEALIGASYYLYNLVTVQTFFAPYEAFVGHYAGLPWLLWGALRLIHQYNRKNMLIFTLLNLVFMTQFYVPTLFVVYGVTLTVIMIGYLSFNLRKQTFMHILGIYLVTLCIHAFWLAPFAYDTITNNQVIVQGKINQMATEDTFLKNQTYGTIQDTLTLKNFWFDTTEYYPKANKTEFMLATWSRYMGQPA